MSIEFIGIAATQETSEPSDGLVIQPKYLRALAKAHEDAGFDWVLVAQSPSSPDSFIIADQILTHTRRLGVLLAPRPGLLAPTLTARAFATLDAFHRGRIGMHVFAGCDEAGEFQDGVAHESPIRYARTEEFLAVVRQEWESAEPFVHHGDFYRVEGGWSAVRPVSPIPIYFGGASKEAVRVGGRHADVFAFWGEPPRGIIRRIHDVRAAAAPYRRTTSFGVSLRPIVAATESEAWAKAKEIVEQRRDARLSTAVAKATGAAGNSPSLVGSYEQVAESLQEYVDLGVDTLLMRGFHPLDDAKDYGTLIDLVRNGPRERQWEGRSAS